MTCAPQEPLMDTCRKTVTDTKARYPLNESFDNAFWYQL